MRQKQWTSWSLKYLVKHAHRILRLAFRKSRPIRGILKEKVMKVIKFSSLGLRRVCTTTPSSKTLMRLGLIVVAVASAVFIAGCGGGGGGESPSFGGTPPVLTPPVVTPPVVNPPVINPPVVTPPVVEKPTVTISSVLPTGTVANNTAVVTKVTIERATAATLAVTAVCGGVGVTMSVPPVPASGGDVSALPVSGTWPDGATCIISAKANAQNAVGAAPEATGGTTFTVAPKMDSYDRVTVMSFAGYPAIAGPDKLPILAKNDTGYTVGDFPVSQCLGSTEPQPDGRYPVLCSIASLGGDLMPISWLITENRLVKWEGALPAGLEYSKNTNGGWNFGVKWKGCMRVGCSTGLWGTPPVPESVVPMFSWAPLKEGGFLYSTGQDLWFRSTEGVNLLLKDYTGTQFPVGYPFSAFLWTNTISN